MWHWERNWGRDWEKGGIPGELHPWFSSWGLAASSTWIPWDIPILTNKSPFSFCRVFVCLFSLELILVPCRLTVTLGQERHNEQVKDGTEQTLEITTHSLVISHSLNSLFSPSVFSIGTKRSFRGRNRNQFYSVRRILHLDFYRSIKTWLFLIDTLSSSPHLSTLSYSYIILCFLKISSFFWTSESYSEGNFAGGSFCFSANVV